MATFVHIGDTHLRLAPGAPVRQFRDPLPALLPGRACLEALDWILKDAASIPDLAAWLWPGDLYDATSSVEDRVALSHRVVLMADRAPVVIVYGNHDQPLDLAWLRWLGHGRHQVVVVDRPSVVTVRCATGERAAIFAIPYPTRGGLIAAGTPADQVHAAGHAALDAICAQGLADLEASGCAMQLVIGHANIAGSLSSAGQPQIGQEIELAPALLERFKPRYIGFNHIHRAQSILCGGARALYAGSICRQDWGETERKSYVRASYDDRAPWPWHLIEIEIPVAPMYHVEARLTPEGLDDVRVTRGPEGETLDEPASWEGCEVRVRYRFLASDRARLDESMVRARFGSALRLEIDAVVIPDRTVRAPDVVYASSVTDKVQAFVLPTMPDLDAAELADKVAQLQALSDDAAVQAFLGRLSVDVCGLEGVTV